MTRLQDDFYHAINGEWEKTAVIPDDKPRTGGFSDLADEIENLMPVSYTHLTLPTKLEV